MQSKRKLKKKSLMFIIAILAIGTIGVTFAVFYTNFERKNVFNTAEYNVTIEENAPEATWPNVTREVTIANQGTADVVLRVSYNEMWTKTISEQVINMNNLVAGENVVTKNWTEEFANNFILKDGWYYYNKVLNGKTNVKILDSLTLNETILNDNGVYDEYTSADYELDFNFESVQASEAAIEEVWGIDATIDGESITWNF